MHFLSAYADLSIPVDFVIKIFFPLRQEKCAVSVYSVKTGLLKDLNVGIYCSRQTFPNQGIKTRGF